VVVGWDLGLLRLLCAYLDLMAGSPLLHQGQSPPQVVWLCQLPLVEWSKTMSETAVRPDLRLMALCHQPSSGASEPIQDIGRNA
jgi:hypothetical protein